MLDPATEVSNPKITAPGRILSPGQNCRATQAKAAGTNTFAPGQFQSGTHETPAGDSSYLDPASCGAHSRHRTPGQTFLGVIALAQPISPPPRVFTPGHSRLAIHAADAGAFHTRTPRNKGAA
jgi:hypothetical protein